MESSAADSPEPDGSTGTYVLRELISDLPLTTDEDDVPARITCVDTWNGNLYIGTSAGEVLHYVSIPGDPSDSSSAPSYIFASRLEPRFETARDGRDAGVKQILLLPHPGTKPDRGKAAILCNGMLTFYTIPELSPAYGARIQQDDCTWVGGLDLNRNGEDNEAIEDPVIVISYKTMLRQVKIGLEARQKNRIMLENVSAIQRRGDLACVADSTKYMLLDVVKNAKNDLFNISSLSVPDPPQPPPDSSRGSTASPSRRFSSASPARQAIGHQRNVSLDSPWPARNSSRRRVSPPPAPSREASPPKTAESAAGPAAPAQPTAVSYPLPPNIVSPSPEEFLLTTGTSLSEPGVGLVINLDGDPSGGALEFSTYPESLVFDGSRISANLGTSDIPVPDGYILAIVRKQFGDAIQKVVEIQRWNSDEAQRSKEWVQIPSLATSSAEVAEQHVGLRLSSTAAELTVSDISKGLRQRRLYLNGKPTDADEKRNKEEDTFAARLSHIVAHVLLYTHDRVSWIMRNPLILQLQHQLALAVQRSTTGELLVDVPGVQTVINSIRGQEARDELEFLSLTYIRQKASLLLFGNLLLRTARGVIAHELEKRFADEALVSGEIDPRAMLSLIPTLRNEIREGQQGIWLAQGLLDTISLLHQSFAENSLEQDIHGAYGENILGVVKHYLWTLRKKKGFGSVADEANVFQTVDGTLLHILLLLDQNSARGPAMAGSVRAELRDLVDKGVDCFDRAVELLEQFHRLYMLSRLYQSRKMAAQVLATWKRILEGEPDAGGEFIQGEQHLRRYLTNIHNHALVQEYGAWLANRNPLLGVQVFADEHSRVKFEPSEALSILREQAPGAVKDYLEHLVFDKNHVQYVNDLVAFYLDTVLAELTKTDEITKNLLLQSYETYRALHPPKPTYRQFITDNAIDADWWRNRLRLLQLIGGSHGAASKYDVHALRERLAPYSSELVPELIILNGREGKHEEALRLLTHGLGDYDTAIRYCLLGGSSIFHLGSDLGPEQPIPSKEEQARLFEYLLHEFFRIEDLGVRLERTAELLERFGGWFDVADVLALIPDGWSVELVSGYLIHAFRRLVYERDELVVVRALASAQNLKRSVDVIEKIEGFGPSVVGGESGLVVS